MNNDLHSHVGGSPDKRHTPFPQGPVQDCVSCPLRVYPYSHVYFTDEPKRILVLFVNRFLDLVGG